MYNIGYTSYFCLGCLFSIDLGGANFGHAFKRTYVQNKKQRVQVFTMGSLRVALDMVRHKDTQRILQKLLDESSPMPPAGEL